jgi:Sulfatase
MPVELTGHSVGLFPFVTVIACGQQLTGGVSWQKYSQTDWRIRMTSEPRSSVLQALAAIVLLAVVFTAPAHAQQKKPPNILVIWGDDIGWQNVSAYGMGTMGYTTPNIDSIGMGGIRFTDHYAQPSCTAGRAAFITGQYPIRSGMTMVGQPGDPLGLQASAKRLLCSAAASPMHILPWKISSLMAIRLLSVGHARGPIREYFAGWRPPGNA